MKLIKIITQNGGSTQSPISKHDCPHLIEEVGEVSTKDFNDAINKIIVWLVLNKKYSVHVDVEELEKKFAPPVEMTIEEIEMKLGHKVKIVSVES